MKVFLLFAAAAATAIALASCGPTSNYTTTPSDWAPTSAPAAPC